MAKNAGLIISFIVFFGSIGFAEEMSIHLNPAGFITDRFALEIVHTDGRRESHYGGPGSGRESRFNNGSLAKVFTAVLSARLNQEGILSLNKELQPGITLEHILTHTSGLQQRGFATAATPDGYYPACPSELRQFPVIHPGEAIIYSSPAFALIEEEVEKITGKPFEDIMEEKLFRPLGLMHSGWEPLPPGPKDRQKNSYPPYRTLLPGSGNIVSSPDDMVKLLKMLLSGGEVYLSTGSIEELYRLKASHGDPGYGRTSGFHYRTYNGTAVISHDGAAPGTNSRLLLVPEQGTGFYLIYDSPSLEPKNELTNQFLTALLGPEATPGSLLTPVPTDSPGKEGFYIPLTNSQTTMEKINNLVSQIRVQNRGETMVIGGREYSYREGDVFYRKDSFTPAAFHIINGRQYLTIGNTLHRKAAGLETLPIQAVMITLSVGGVFSGLLLRHRGLWRLLDLGFLTVLFIYVSRLVLMDIWRITYGTPGEFLILSCLLTAAALTRLINEAVTAMRRRNIPVGKNWSAWISPASMIILVLWLNHYNLIRF